MKLTTRDRARLASVHPDLVRVVERAAEITQTDFLVVEGLRTLERQRELFRAGKSKTMRSRHLLAPNGFGHAVDIAPIIDTDGDGDLELSWAWADFRKLAPVVQLAAKEVGVPIEWGGAWTTFKDAPHWQLPWANYPGT